MKTQLLKSIRCFIITTVVAILSVGQPILLRTFTVYTAAILLSASNAHAKDASEIAEIAKAITVRIEGATQGSGVLVKKKENRYTVLTSWHVVKDNRIGEEVGIITSDGKEHLWDSKSLQRLGKVDMAVITFTSKRNYQVAKIGDIKTVSMGNQIFVAGFPLPSYAVPISFLRFLDGKVIANARVGIPDGYQLLYSNPTLKGMSGGCVLDKQGTLVGIHGRAEQDDQISLSTGKFIATRTNMAVPITYYQQFENGEKIVAATNESTTSDDYLAESKAFLGEKVQKDLSINSFSEKIKKKDKKYLKPSIDGSEDINFYFNRALDNEKLGRYKEAIQDYDLIVQMKISEKGYYYENALYSRAWLKIKNKKNQKGAIEDIKKLIIMNPWDINLKLDLASFYSSNNKNKKAVQILDKAIKENPFEGNLYYWKGIYKNEYSYPSGCRYINKAKKLKASDWYPGPWPNC